MTACAGGLYGARVGGSLLVGGAIGLLATSYLAFVMVKHALRPARPATVLGLFGNWFVKTAMVLGLLAVALRSERLVPPAVLAGLAGSLVCYWLAMVIGAKRGDTKTGTR